KSDDRDRAGLRAVPAQSGAVLPARRSRCAARRSEYRTLLRDGAQDGRVDPVRVHQPQQDNDGNGRAIDRDYHARPGRFTRGCRRHRGGAGVGGDAAAETGGCRIVMEALLRGMAMNSLFMGLVVAGVALVIAVLLYNMMQERRAKRRLKAAFGGTSRGDGERAEPSLRRDDREVDVPLSVAVETTPEP